MRRTPYLVSYTTIRSITTVVDREKGRCYGQVGGTSHAPACSGARDDPDRGGAMGHRAAGSRHPHWLSFPPGGTPPARPAVPAELVESSGAEERLADGRGRRRPDARGGATLIGARAVGRGGGPGCPAPLCGQTFRRAGRDSHP